VLRQRLLQAVKRIVIVVPSRVAVFYEALKRVRV